MLEDDALTPLTDSPFALIDSRLLGGSVEHSV